MSETLVENEDLLVFREDPLVDVEDEFGASFFILLRNFSLNSHLLRAAHVDVLRNRVVPFIQRRPGFAEIYGMTDRSGARKLNYQIAASRLLAVQQGMLGLGHGVPRFITRLRNPSAKISSRTDSRVTARQLSLATASRTLSSGSSCSA